MEFIEAILTATAFSARRFLIVIALLIRFIFILHIALYVEHQAGKFGETQFQNWCRSTREYNPLPLSS